MPPRIPKPLAERRPWLAVAQAYGRAFWSGKRLPPGKLIDIGALEREHRTLLIDCAAQHGPVFKGLMERRLTVCVVGHALGRRLLKEHSGSLRAVSIRLEQLFPHGFMRGMEGDTHRTYRKSLARGIASLDMASLTPAFESIVTEALETHAATRQQPTTPQAWADTLGQIANSTLITLFFGPKPGDAAHARLLAAYLRLGPRGVVWNLTSQQVDAYRALADEVAALGVNAGGLLAHLHAQGTVDPTMLGNLVYMVELGRYDLRGLLRWISRYAADNNDWLDGVASDAATCASGDSGGEAERSFVLEALRMDQSERLMREVLDDIVVDGWLIPSGALVRVCMWEAHKDPQKFPQPFTFDPVRFRGVDSEGENFSPFGLDHHHCPLAGPVVEIAVIFLRVLARKYAVDGRSAEPPVRGPYHWEPSPRFDVTLVLRAAGTRCPRQ
jgi:cytochrome P450